MATAKQINLRIEKLTQEVGELRTLKTKLAGELKIAKELERGSKKKK